MKMIFIAILFSLGFTHSNLFPSEAARKYARKQFKEFLKSNAKEEAIKQQGLLAFDHCFSEGHNSDQGCKQVLGLLKLSGAHDGRTSQQQILDILALNPRYMVHNGEILFIGGTVDRNGNVWLKSGFSFE